MAGTVKDQIDKIAKQRSALDAKLNSLLAKANKAIIDQIVKLAKDNNITKDQLIAALGGSVGKSNEVPSENKTTPKSKKPSVATKKADKRSKVEPVYRNPDNPEETWTKRGRTPVWAQKLKDAGLLETALIKKPLTT